MRKSNKNIYKSVLALFVVTISVTGCGDFLDINKDPNNPLDSPNKQVLPVVETVVFEALGNGSGGMSDLTSQFVHQTVQRGPSNFYFFQGNEFNISSAWPNLYAGALMDIKQIIAKSEKTGSYHYLGVSQILKAYIYSMMVDLWGKAAYTHFGEGTANPFPGYDEGADIYPQLFTLLDDGIENLGKDAAETLAGDLVYGGDTDKWTRFANSLKLKLYNQVRLTTMYDAAAVDALMASTDLMSKTADGFRLLYSTSNNPENRHPLFKQDYVDANSNNIDPYFYLLMTDQPSSLTGDRLNPVLSGIVDPRIRYYFYNQLDSAENPANKYPVSARYTNFLSIWFASFNIDPNEGFDQELYKTKVGLYPAGGAYDDYSGKPAGVQADQNAGLGGAGYQRLYPYFADLYTRAELVLTMGAASADDDRTLFSKAMQESFNEVNDLAPNDIDQSDIDDYISAVLTKYDAASPDGKLELIMTEKWIASFGSTVDAFTDYRRTGYPVMFDPSTDNNPLTILNRNYPVSLPYFIDDLQINPNAPAQRNPGSDKVFWDQN
jgi:hypothetical protein